MTIIFLLMFFVDNISFMVLLLCALILNLAYTSVDKSSGVLIFIILLVYITGVLMLFFYSTLLLKPFKLGWKNLKHSASLLSLLLVSSFFYSKFFLKKIQPLNIVLDFEQSSSESAISILMLIMLSSLLCLSLLLKKSSFLRQVK